MQFKIDTKDFYTHIIPVGNRIDAIMTGVLREKWSELAQKGNANALIDLSNCTEADTTSFADLIRLHEEVYSSAASLVFTGVQEHIMKELKKEHVDTQINIVPTMAEAIDMISMEMLERDLFDEES
ncbi:MAG: STAS domain-containing protein [Bacteroidetes bacterium]|nr:STAS domain-containing protein [Bacteroidota bacterium]